MPLPGKCTRGIRMQFFHQRTTRVTRCKYNSFTENCILTSMLLSTVQSHQLNSSILGCSQGENKKWQNPQFGCCIQRTLVRTNKTLASLQNYTHAKNNTMPIPCIVPCNGQCLCEFTTTSFHHIWGTLFRFGIGCSPQRILARTKTLYWCLSSPAYDRYS